MKCKKHSDFIKKYIKIHHEPLIDFLNCLSDHELDQLFSIFDVVNDSLIFDSSDESLLFSEFMTTFFIAARSYRLLEKSKKT